MNSISKIRNQLGVTQSVLAAELRVTQGNVSHYENGQSMPPEVAKLLIAFAAARGFSISYDDIYGRPDVAPPHALHLQQSTNPR
jgi:putative transcriptional regulator